MNAPAKVEVDTLASAMARAFGAIDKATKAAKGQVGQQKYNYADLSGVIDAIKPALVENSLFFTQQPEPAQGGVQVRTVLHHASGESLDMGTLFVPANKNDAQGYGSALTYARRYALVTAFGVPTEDDDGNAAVKAVQGQSNVASPDPEPCINGEQVTRIQVLLEATGITPVQFSRTMSVRTVSSLPASRFEEAVERLETALAKKAKESTDDKARETA
jgi:hypothetical protein